VTIDWEPLRQAALGAQARAHAPYSGYQVGAALLTRAGEIFPGCNVENASYGLTVCAERTAICSMVAAGERDPVAIFIVTPGDDPGTPCGMCRQVLAEFAVDLPIRLRGASGAELETTLGELLPRAFRPSALGR
jgi:cytidine deaminase